jgi:hypothetical protein
LVETSTDLAGRCIMTDEEMAEDTFFENTAAAAAAHGFGSNRLSTAPICAKSSLLLRRHLPTRQDRERERLDRLISR